MAKDKKQKNGESNDSDAGAKPCERVCWGSDVAAPRGLGGRILGSSVNHHHHVSRPLNDENSVPARAVFSGILRAFHLATSLL